MSSSLHFVRCSLYTLHKKFMTDVGVIRKLLKNEKEIYSFKLEDIISHSCSVIKFYSKEK